VRKRDGLDDVFDYTNLNNPGDRETLCDLLDFKQTQKLRKSIFSWNTAELSRLKAECVRIVEELEGKSQVMGSWYCVPLTDIKEAIKKIEQL
jgi:ABC-type transporter Mla MlaB component